MKKLLVFIGLALACRLLVAQTLPLVKFVPDYPFAHFENNRLTYPGDSLPMERFFSKMDSVVFLGEGNISIMHIGGSHVQAGIFTQQFRDNLLSISPDLIGGKNFVFPFSAGGTNNPSHYIVRSTGNWSYCRNAVRRETDKRMGLETDNVVPVVSYDSSLLRGLYDEWKSTYTFLLPDFTDSICILFDSVPGEFTLTGVLLENDMSGISVHGVGVNGASVPSYLRCHDFERDLKLIKPDLIIFSIGINDAADTGFNKSYFKQNYKELISIIQRVNPDCALLFVTNNDSFKKIRKNKYQVNLNGPVVEEAFMEMGKDYNAAVWNQFDIMGGLKSMEEWEKAGLAKKDKVHFTNEGYKLLGDLLYNALITRYIEHVQLNAKRP